MEPLSAVGSSSSVRGPAGPGGGRGWKVTRPWQGSWQWVCVAEAVWLQVLAQSPRAGSFHGNCWRMLGGQRGLCRHGPSAGGSCPCWGPAGTRVVPTRPQCKGSDPHSAKPRSTSQRRCLEQTDKAAAGGTRARQCLEQSPSRAQSPIPGSQTCPRGQQSPEQPAASPEHSWGWDCGTVLGVAAWCRPTAARGMMQCSAGSGLQWLS